MRSEELIRPLASLRIVVVAALLALPLLACGHTDPEMRFWCLRSSNASVRGPEKSCSSHDAMVHQLYKMCLEAKGVPYAPLPLESETPEPTR